MKEGFKVALENMNTFFEKEKYAERRIVMLTDVCDNSV